MSSKRSGVFYGILIGVVSMVTGMVIASRLDLVPRSLASITVPATNSAPLTGTLDASTFRTIAHEQSPAVVSITVEGMHQATPEDMGGLQFFFNGQSQGRRGGGGANQQVPFAGQGSGFIIDKSGYILTNNHVVEDADKITVKLASMGDPEEGLAAKVIGRDKLADVALIQLTEMPTQPLAEAKFGDSDQIAAGDWVMAIGNPFGLSGTVTVGVVSSVGRLTMASQSADGTSARFEKMIQTDAAINPGNSGGPLLNIRGEVIGINTMIYADQQGSGNLGVGFAVPINEVHALLPMLKTGKIVRGRIGVTVERKPLKADYRKENGLPATGGALITSVDPGPALDGGMKISDFVVEFDGKPVADDGDLVSLVTATAPGTTVPVKVIRDGKPLTLHIKVGELDLAQETGEASARPNMPIRQRPQQPRPDAAPKATAFGLTLRDMDTSLAQQLNLPDTTTGAIVWSVEPRGAASGVLVRGDVIVEVNKKTVKTTDQAAAALEAVPAGGTANVIVLRNGRELLILLRNTK